MNYLKDVYGLPVPQSEPLPEREEEMVKNQADGYVFTVDNFTRLERFLILGSEGNTYYASQREMTQANAKAVRDCIREHGRGTVEAIVGISETGRAPKNSPALFALAMCLSFGDRATKALASLRLPKVARTASHLMEFVAYARDMRGWGRRMKAAVANGWYLSKSGTPVGSELERLIYQVLKYRERNGWSHRDLLRMAHPTAPPELQHLYAWITKGTEPPNEPEYIQIHAFEQAKTAGAKEVAAIVREHRLTREMIPREHSANPDVLAALAKDMPLTALIRNLGNLTKAGVIAPMSDHTWNAVGMLRDVDHLRKARIHPIQIISALRTYMAGRGILGSNKWAPVSQVCEALEAAVDLTFETVPSTGQRYYVGVDISVSMGGGTIAGVPGLSPRVAAGIMALVIAKREAKHEIMGFGAEMVPLGIIASDSVNSVEDKLLRANWAWNNTDCALPMLDAMERKIPVDCFVILTDNETWYGRIHPVVALHEYRRQMGISAKLVVVGMTATEFTIADPKDAGMLDVVGFDASAPRIIADFVTGKP